MQSQMIGLQSSLDRILTHLQSPPQQPQQAYPSTPVSATAFAPASANATRFPPSSGGHGGPSPESSFFPTTPGGGGSTSAAGVVAVAGSQGPIAGSSTGASNVASGSISNNGKRRFPPLPGFAPPPHKYATYGIVPSTAPSSDDESEDTLPRATLNAPIEALQGLANAAAEVAASDQPPYVPVYSSSSPSLLLPLTHRNLLTDLRRLFSHLLPFSP